MESLSLPAREYLVAKGLVFPRSFKTGILLAYKKEDGHRTYLIDCGRYWLCRGPKLTRAVLEALFWYQKTPSKVEKDTLFSRMCK